MRVFFELILCGDSFVFGGFLSIFVFLFSIKIKKNIGIKLTLLIASLLTFFIFTFMAF